MYSIGVKGLFWRVMNWDSDDELDLSWLSSIQCGKDAFWFNDDDDSTLVLKGNEWRETWCADLPRLTTLTAPRSDLCVSYCYPHHITLSSGCMGWKWEVDMPRLYTLRLSKVPLCNNDVRKERRFNSFFGSFIEIGAFSSFYHWICFFPTPFKTMYICALDLSTPFCNR